METIAKLFWSGHSQAIRLPKSFRFDGTEVRIAKQGNKLIIEPIENDWNWLDEILSHDTDPSWEKAVADGRQLQAQKRDWDCFK